IFGRALDRARRADLRDPIAVDADVDERDVDSPRWMHPRVPDKQPRRGSLPTVVRPIVAAARTRVQASKRAQSPRFRGAFCLPTPRQLPDTRSAPARVSATQEW